MTDHNPKRTYAGVFIIYSQLGLSYAAFDATATRLAKALEPGGIMVIGQSPADPEKVPADAKEWDETKSYVSGFNLPFMGEPFATLMFTREGQKKYLRSLGLEVVYETVNVFREWVGVHHVLDAVADFCCRTSECKGSSRDSTICDRSTASISHHTFNFRDQSHTEPFLTRFISPIYIPSTPALCSRTCPFDKTPSL